MNKPISTLLGRRQFMAEKNIKRLVRSGLRAATAAHPGCIDQTLTKNVVNTISGRVMEAYYTNPNDGFMSEDELERILVVALRNSEGVIIPVLGGSIAKRIRMALIQSYESHIR
jgi:hypothetical protein